MRLARWSSVVAACVVTLSACAPLPPAAESRRGMPRHHGVPPHHGVPRHHGPAEARVLPPVDPGEAAGVLPACEGRVVPAEAPVVLPACEGQVVVGWPDPEAAVAEPPRPVFDIVCPAGDGEWVITSDDIEVWDELAVEVLYGALVGHDDEALGLELDDGQLLLVRLPTPDDDARRPVLDALATAAERDRVALRVRWEAGDRPTVEAFLDAR